MQVVAEVMNLDPVADSADVFKRGARGSAT